MLSGKPAPSTCICHRVNSATLYCNFNIALCSIDNIEIGKCLIKILGLQGGSKFGGQLFRCRESLIFNSKFCFFIFARTLQQVFDSEKSSYSDCNNQCSRYY